MAAPKSAPARNASGRKRARQSIKNRQHNRALRSRVRTAIKNVFKALATNDRSQAEAEYRRAVPVIDSLVNKGLLHRNKAARHKSRLNERVRAL